MTNTQPVSGGWLTPATPPPTASHQPCPPRAAPSQAQRPARKTKGGRSVDERQPTPEALRIAVWNDVIITEAIPTTGFYMQRYYGPIVGPTCLYLVRTLASRLATDRDGFAVQTADLAASIGCSSRGGLNSQFWKAFRRGTRFGLLKQANDRVSVRTAVSPLPARLAQRLPEQLRKEHQLWDHRSGPPPIERFAESLPAEPVESIEILRLAARGLCTPDELRSLDRAHKLR